MLLKQPLTVTRYSVEDLINLGLPQNQDQMPSMLARFAQLTSPQRRQRRNRRIGTVGNIDTISQGTQTSISIAWKVARSIGLPVPVPSNGPNVAVATNIRQPVNYTFGSTGVGCINQVAQVSITCTNGTPVNFAADVWAQNVIGDASATFSAYKELWIELLNTTQGGGGATSSGITLGHHATNAWAAILGATGTYTMGAGALWHVQEITSAGLGITTGDFIKTVNNDPGNIATIRLTAFGYK